MGLLRMAAALATAVALAVAGACGENPPRAAGGDPEPARIYAAASLSEVIRDVAGRFEAPSHGAVRVVASLGASSTLAQQIRDGAQPGVFISASAEWVDKLESWGMVEPGTRVNLAATSLVVIVPRGADLLPQRLQDLTDARYARIAIADPTAVPAGHYAKAALEKVGVFDGLRSRLVAAQDVRAALAYVARGEAPVGIVYATDAAASDAVVVAFAVPSGLHPAIVYPMVLVKGAGPRARELHAFLRTPEAWAVLESAGFTRP